MKRHQPAFKDTQIYGWDSEPADERPSEFPSSGGYSSLSGYYPMPATHGAALHHRKRRGGLNLVMLAGVAIIGLGLVAMFGLVHILRA